MKKDIILMVGGGGMTGIFSSGVLKPFESDEIYNRIHSVYAVSVGGPVGARFKVKQSELCGKTFYTRFNNEKFIKGNFVRYFFQVLKNKRDSNHKIDDILDFDYFEDIILHSEDKIDMEKVKDSRIPFYVKVFNRNKKVHEYICVEGPNAYEKVIASASMTPLISKKFIIEGEELFDGDTIPLNLEEKVIKENPDKTIIRINNHKDSIGSYFNIFRIGILHRLFKTMYDSEVSNLYIKNSFKKILWDRSLKKYNNLIQVVNKIPMSLFCKDETKLKEVYAEGLRKGNELVMRLKRD